MRFFKHYIFFILLLTPLLSFSQNDYESLKKRMKSQYSSFVDKARQEYNEFRQRANEEYARFMEEAWERMNVTKGEEPPERPKPVRQPEVLPDRIPPSQPIPLPEPEVVPLPEKVPPPEIDPEEAIKELPVPTPNDATTEMDFYGTILYLHIDKSKQISLNNVSEKEAAGMWRQLSDGRYDALLRDCLEIRNNLKLCDWGYIELAEKVAGTALGQASNEAVILQAWLLSQSGVALRIAKSNGRFVLMVSFDENIYGYSYINIKGSRFYILDDSKDGELSVCDIAFPKSHIASLHIQQLPLFDISNNNQRTFEAKHFVSLKASVSTNKHLMDFFENYPQSTSYKYYVDASLSKELKEQLFPMFKQQLEGKSKKKQVQMLLDFVQTSFDYQTDREQFGRERSFFGDESFYHPYNDCEDRSILFSILVRELVGLDVVLLILPQHMATAVCFDTEVPGNFYTVNGKRYTVCDPTYINAGIGEAMPQFQNAKAKFVIL